MKNKIIIKKKIKKHYLNKIPPPYNNFKPNNPNLKIILSKNSQPKLNTDNNFKDSLDENVSSSRTNLLIPDSLNNSKTSIIINSDEIYSKINNDKKRNSNSAGKDNEKTPDTKKIDYRYYTNYPIRDFLTNKDNCNNNESYFYWLATYDKLIKRKKIIKILNYYYKENKYKESDIKEKLTIIKDFEIFFPKNSNKPLIKYSKNGYIFVKLYLLTLNDINIILSYINRLTLDIPRNILEKSRKKGNFEIITDEKNNNITYNLLYFIGSYMNFNIFAFSSSYEEEINSNDSYNYNNPDLLKKDINQKMPNSKKIAKFIKLLLQNFPKYKTDFFICYLLAKIKFRNFSEKSNEIKSYLYNKNTNTNYKNKKLNSNSLAEVATNSLSYLSKSIVVSNGYNATEVKTNTNLFEINEKKYHTVHKFSFMFKNSSTTKSKSSTNKKFSENIKKIKKNRSLNKNIRNFTINNSNKMRNKENQFNSYTNKIKFPNKIKTDLKQNLNLKTTFAFINNININKSISTQNKNKNKSNKKRAIGKINGIGNNSLTKKTINKSSSLSKNFNNFITYNSKNNITINSIHKKYKKSIPQPSICYNKNAAKKFYSNSDKNKIDTNNILTKKSRSKGAIKKKSLTKNKNKKNTNSIIGSIKTSFRIDKKPTEIRALTEKNSNIRKYGINRGVYVVDRRMKTDIEDDDSSFITKKAISKDDKENFNTPSKKKKMVYYC